MGLATVWMMMFGLSAYDVSIAIKPAIHTQHFLTEHAYWGIGLEIPISAPIDDDLTAFVEFFISAGYKF